MIICEFCHTSAIIIIKSQDSTRSRDIHSSRKKQLRHWAFIFRFFETSTSCRNFGSWMSIDAASFSRTTTHQERRCENLKTRNHRLCICALKSAVITSEQETCAEFKCGCRCYMTQSCFDISNTEQRILSCSIIMRSIIKKAPSFNSHVSSCILFFSFYAIRMNLHTTY